MILCLQWRHNWGWNGWSGPPNFPKVDLEIHTKMEKKLVSQEGCGLCNLPSNECSKRKSILKLAERVFSVFSEILKGVVMQNVS